MVLYNIIVCRDDDGRVEMERNEENKEDFTNYDEYLTLKTSGNGNNAVVMGKNCWKNLCKNGDNPFIGVDNLIITKTFHLDKNINSNLIKTFPFIDYGQTPHKHHDPHYYLINFIKDKNYNEVWIIGGQRLIETIWIKGYINKIYTTNLHKKYNHTKNFVLQPLWLNNKYLESEEFKTKNGTSYSRSIYKAYQHY